MSVLIGITLDSRESGDFSATPFYAVRKTYCDALTKAGGVPVGLTHDMNLIEAYLDHIDGLVITGGRHDIPPDMYGDTEVHPTVLLNLSRTNFELALAKAALARNMPVLGVCGGAQIINVVLGGTLIQHIEGHLQKAPRTQTFHPITVTAGSLLHRILGCDTMDVNSVHHQAVKTPGKGVVVNAVAPDGIIEGIEAPGYRFCLGTQWHPEDGAAPLDANIFTHFLQAVRDQG